MARFLDAVSAGTPRRTSDGYLVADVRAARTGMQIYGGHEVGRPDLATVRVYRPESEVFHKDSLASYAHKPAVNGHPPVSVSAENWKDYATGQMGGDVVRDGDHVRVPLVLMDAKAIADYDAGRRELSMGYTAEIEFGDGVTPAGEAYDAIQKNIRINHISQEAAGRAGTARIGDSVTSWGATPVDDKGFIEPQPGGKPITQSSKGGHNMSDALKTVVLGDKAVKVPAEDVAAIEQFKTDSAKALADAESKHEKTLADKDAELAKLQAKLDDAESKILSDADIDKRVSDRADLVSLAKSIAPNIKTQGVSDADIRKAVVTTKLGDAVIEGKSEAYIDARFDILADEAKQSNPVNDAFKSTAQGEPLNDSYNGYLDRLTRKQEA